MDWEVVDLGRMGYAAALEVQRQRNAALLAGQGPETLLLVEHDPVVTLTSRPNIREHLLASPRVFESRGIALEPTDRGGDVTYHGPGQLVAYPILRLADHRLNLSRYMRLLEQAVIQTVAPWGVVGVTECGATGVWVEGSVSGEWECVRRESGCVSREGEALENSPRLTHLDSRPTTKAKLCAMGVRIRKGTTLHGLALNVTTDLSHFELIDPCGLGGRPVTSLQALLGERCPTMGQVKAALVRTMGRLLDASRAAPLDAAGLTGCAAG